MKELHTVTGAEWDGEIMTRESIEVREQYLNNKGHFHYRACGLDNVFLKSGFNISQDGFSYSISNIMELHDCIGLFLAKQTSILAPKELKFLRKELRLTQSDLASRIGVDVQTVARWEKGETENKMADRMIRVLYVTNRLVSDSGRGEEIANDLLDLLGFLEAVNMLDDTSDSERVFEMPNNWRMAG